MLDQLDRADLAFERAAKIDAPCEEHAVMALYRAVLRARQRRWAEALEDADGGLRFFEGIDVGAETRSLAMALTYRAMIKTWAWEDGESGFEFAHAESDYLRAIRLGTFRTKRTTLTALTNFAALHAINWFRGNPMQALTPQDILELILEIRKSLTGPRRRYNIRHRIELTLAWLEGLALARLGVSLHTTADKILCRARDGFLDRGLVHEAVQVAMDRQYWLLHDDRISTAIREAGEMAEILQDSHPTWALLLEDLANSLREELAFRGAFEKVKELPQGERLHLLLHEAAIDQSFKEVRQLAFGFRQTAMNYESAADQLRRKARRLRQSGCSQRTVEFEAEADFLQEKASRVGQDVVLLDEWRQHLAAHARRSTSATFTLAFERLRGISGVAMPWVIAPHPAVIDTGGF